MAWYWMALILLGILSFLLLIGVPAGFAMGLTAAIIIVVFLGPGQLIQIAEIAYDRGSDSLFIVAPLFILMAGLVAYSGVAQAAYTAASRWFNRVPGSLAVSTVAGSASFAAVSGSSVATALTMGVFSIPEMIRHGYSKRLAVGCVASAGTLGILIPPSISMVIFGIITETSIGQLFIAGIIPGILIAILLALYVILLAKFRPDLAPPTGSFTWKERFGSLRPVWGILVLFVLVMGSIYTGIATVAEAAGVGAAGALLLTLVNRRLTRARLGDALIRSAETTAMVMFLLIGGFALAFVAASTGIAHGIGETLVNSGLPSWAVIAAYMALLLILGIPLETGTIIVITMPILFEPFKQLGFDPLWLGVLTTVNSEIGTISPPAGLVLFSMKSVTPQEVSMNDIMLGVLPFNVVLLVGLIILMIFPELSTWLPSKVVQ